MPDNIEFLQKASIVGLLISFTNGERQDLMQLMDGKKVSQDRRRALQKRVAEWTEETGVKPGLAVVIVGEDPASHVYVRNKIRSCEKVGMVSKEVRLPADTSREALKQAVEDLNNDPSVHGYLVQLPLPAHLHPDEVVTWIDPKKDADGLTAENLGLLFSGRPRVVPCTPQGVMYLLEAYKIDIQGKYAVVVGRSQIVGRPMAQLLLNANATVTTCHSKTKDLRSFTSQADIVVVAAGRPEMLGREDFKQGAVVIDVGIHRRQGDDGRVSLCGDVRWNELQDWASAATPVPGGVGPMTITTLLENTLHLAQLSSTSNL